MVDVDIYHWIYFNVAIFILLGLDLWHFYLHPHSIKFKEALYTTLGWILLAFLFNGWLYYRFGAEPALSFFTGYLLEESLSVDNLFIFLLIFSHFKVPDESKHRVLFYGVLGAIIMRGVLIWAGLAFIEHFEWAFYIFGAFLIYTGIKMGFSKESTLKLDENRLYRVFQSTIGVTPTYHGQAFFVKIKDKWQATPLLIVVLLIEATDLLFALDSIPAVLGITTDPFIVYTSNIFAILGLRSLFFVLEGMMKRFYLLHYALSLILIFIGVKMLLAHTFPIPTFVALGVLATLLGLAVIGSYLFPMPKEQESEK